jgi:hypothetical protein
MDEGRWLISPGSPSQETRGKEKVGIAVLVGFLGLKSEAKPVSGCLFSRRAIDPR